MCSADYSEKVSCKRWSRNQIIYQVFYNCRTRRINKQIFILASMDLSCWSILTFNLWLVLPVYSASHWSLKSEITELTWWGVGQLYKGKLSWVLISRIQGNLAFNFSCSSVSGLSQAFWSCWTQLFHSFLVIYHPCLKS